MHALANYFSVVKCNCSFPAEEFVENENEKK